MTYKQKIEVIDSTDKTPALVRVHLLDETGAELSSNDMLLSVADKETIDAEIQKLANVQDFLTKEKEQEKSDKAGILALYPQVIDVPSHS